MYLAPFVAMDSVTAADFGINCFVPIFSALEGYLSLSCLGYRYSWRASTYIEIEKIHTEEANAEILQLEKCKASY